MIIEKNGSATTPNMGNVGGIIIVVLTNGSNLTSIVVHAEGFLFTEGGPKYVCTGGNMGLTIIIVGTMLSCHRPNGDLIIACLIDEWGCCV